MIKSCPCGYKSSEGGGILQATRYCGGDFISGALWTEPNVAACNFSDLTHKICDLRNVSHSYSIVLLIELLLLFRYKL